MPLNKKAILLSGGMDSIALAYWKHPDIAITIDYGQKTAEAEIKSATAVAKILNIEHHIISINGSFLGSGSLSDNASLPEAPSFEWWPYRNQLIVTIAAMEAIKLGVEEIMVGTVKSDSAYKDGTEEFYEQLNTLMALQEGGIKITVPAIKMSTEELVRVSNLPIKLLLWAHSCNTSNTPCGRCQSCMKYREVKASLKIS